MRAGWLVVTCIALVVAAAKAAQPAGSEKASVESLSWMAGTWTGEEGGVVMEEHWMEPRGGMMPGLHRDARPGRKTAFEYLRIEEGPEGLVYQASPQGAPATPFLLRSLEARKVVFENPEHDFPQRILYWLDDDGALHARVETMAGVGGEGMEWRWQRAK